MAAIVIDPSKSTLAAVLTVVIFAGVAAAAYAAVRFAILPLVRRSVERSAWHWDDILLDHKVANRLSLLAPLLVGFIGVRLASGLSAVWTDILMRATATALILLGALTLTALLSAANAVYETTEESRVRVIEPYVQVSSLIIVTFATLFIVAIAADRSPWYLVGGFGALMAILLLVFRDTILSIVASIQLMQNRMIHVGDWIEMQEFNADGFVTDVALRTITVQNFDKTIVAIPTYQLVSRPFRNWRGMREAGGRRIKRSLLIDLSSVRFLTEAEMQRFSRFEPLAEYMAHKRVEIRQHNGEMAAPEGIESDSRRLTNLGTFRAYAAEYLRRHPMLATDSMISLVRQLQATPHGLPLEVYVFVSATDWAEYERVQSDVFDHLIAMVPEFGLRLYQAALSPDERCPPAATRAAE